VIRLPPRESLNDAERYGLDLLIDLARLPAVEDDAADVVRLLLTERDPPDPDLRTCIAQDWHFERGAGTVRVPRVVLRRVTAVAAAAAEQQSQARDRHGRVPSSENELVRSALDADPVISQAGARLRAAVIAGAERRPVALAAPWPDGKRWAAAFTHDLDVVAFWPLFTMLRVAELGRKRELRRVGRTLGAALTAVSRNPVRRGVRDVLDDESRSAVVSTWFVLCGTPTLATIRAGDLTYRAESPATVAILRDVAQRGCEIGLHGSFATGDRHALFAEQRSRLERLTTHPVIGVRQHFLRIRPGRTSYGMAAAQFRYDSTYGFPDRNGFRLGVADVIPGWDAGAGQPTGLDEVPFCWMDRALSKYARIEDPGAWIAEGEALAQACRHVEGLWVSVWHPNLTPALGFPGAPTAFRTLVARVVAANPFIGTMSSVVEWRAARRSIRVRHVSPDGRLDAYAPVPASKPLTLEDLSGRTAATVSAAPRALP
jgi:hypothetical protein